MFGLDLFFGGLMDQVFDWAYAQAVGMYSNFFSMIAYMGVEMFELDSVKSVVLFFTYLAWAFYVVGLAVSIFETGIDYQNGRGDIKATAMNAVKGFMAVSVFSIVPIELYALSVNLQTKLTNGITGYGSADSVLELSNNIVEYFGQTPAEGMASSMMQPYGFNNPLLILIALIMFIYAVVKVFFANLKRGGILLIQICVGSLYIFSIPRGYMDGFTSWCKKIIALCLTTFLQTTMLTIGMLVLMDNLIIGMGLMLSAKEVPRIAEVFGLDTSTKTNMMGAVHATQTIVNTAKTIATVAK